MGPLPLLHQSQTPVTPIGIMTANVMTHITLQVDVAADLTAFTKNGIIEGSDRISLRATRNVETKSEYSSF